VEEKSGKTLHPLTAPTLMVLAMWAVYLISLESGVSLVRYGLMPRSIEGLRGILTMPFLHGSLDHLMSNTAPVLILGWALYRFYPTLATKTLLGIWVTAGVWLWISGRESYHIGASGLVYGLAAFLFLSGWLRLEKRVAALSLLVAFLYGGLWWGVLPVDPKMSWEGHLWGAVAGLALAVLYRKQGPQRPVYAWEEEKEEEAQATGVGIAASDPAVIEEAVSNLREHVEPEDPLDNTPDTPYPGHSSYLPTSTAGKHGRITVVYRRRGDSRLNERQHSPGDPNATEEPGTTPATGG
jgi:membrane associated rhomboid family serine protease